jgi:hypothetical protein
MRAIDLKGFGSLERLAIENLPDSPIEDSTTDKIESVAGYAVGLR